MLEARTEVKYFLTKEDWPEGKSAPDYIKGFEVKNLSYCDAEVRDRLYVLVDIRRQPLKPDNLVFIVRSYEPCVTRFKAISNKDEVLGVVIQSVTSLGEYKENGTVSEWQPMHH